MSKPELRWKHNGNWYAEPEDGKCYSLEQIDEGRFEPYFYVNCELMWVGKPANEEAAKAACERHWQGEA